MAVPPELAKAVDEARATGILSLANKNLKAIPGALRLETLSDLTELGIRKTCPLLYCRLILQQVSLSARHYLQAC